MFLFRKSGASVVASSFYGSESPSDCNAGCTPHPSSQHRRCNLEKYARI